MFEHVRVPLLVPIDGVGEGNEDRGFPARRDFRHGGRSGTADEQIGSAERVGYVIQKWDDLEVLIPHHVRVIVLHLCVIPLAGLMDDVKTGIPCRQDGHGRNDRPIDGPRPLAAAQDEERRASVRGHVHLRADALQKLATDRRANDSDLVTPEVRHGLGERHEDAMGKRREEAIRRAGIGIGF